MNFRLNMAAGEFFDLIRPLVLIISALLSTWVLTSARKRFRFSIAAAWALATLLLPPVFFPLYLIARFAGKRSAGNSTSLTQRLVIPTLYFVVVLSVIGWWHYRDSSSVDAHLARAADAKVRGERARTIKEYRQALALEDNPHTHKLLGIELLEAGRWLEALSELRLAERGGEPDPLIAFRIASLLDLMNNPYQASLEYTRFLASSFCAQEPPDSRCAQAGTRIGEIEHETVK